MSVLPVTLSHRVLPMLPSTSPHSRSPVLGRTMPATSLAISDAEVLPEEPDEAELLVSVAVLIRFFTSSSTPYVHRSPVALFRIRRSICPASLVV